MKVYVLLAGWLCMITWLPHCDGANAKSRNKFRINLNPFPPGAIENIEIKPQDVSITMNLDGTASFGFADIFEAAPPPPPERRPEPTPSTTQQPTTRPAKFIAARPPQRQEPRPALKPAGKPTATSAESKVSTTKMHPQQQGQQGQRTRKRKPQPTLNNRPADIRKQASQNTTPERQPAVSKQTTEQKARVSSSNTQSVRPPIVRVITRNIPEERKPLSIPTQRNSNTAQQSQQTKPTPQRSSSFINPSKPAAKEIKPKPTSLHKSNKCLKIHKSIFRPMKQKQFDNVVLAPALKLFKDVEECRKEEFGNYLLALLSHRRDRFGI